MFFIIGSRFFKWGSALTEKVMHCGNCGTNAQFVRKTGLRFITLFFILPVIPISGIKHMIQCPNCKTVFVNNTP